MMQLQPDAVRRTQHEQEIRLHLAFLVNGFDREPPQYVSEYDFRLKYNKLLP